MSGNAMDEQALREILSGRRGGAAAAGVRALTWPASKVYGAVVRRRRRLHRVGVLSGRRAPVPVVSVGNLTTGGTGKTPMVAWVVGRLKKAGRSPAILTRGYKAKAGKSDEAEMLWRRTGVPVVVDPNRAAAAQAAAAAGADVLVLDDGFQHLRLRRDLDIVLIDATCPFGHGHVLPRGLLREPLSALRDADAVVVTRSDLAPPAELEALCRRLAELAPKASLHRAGHVPVAVIVRAGRHLPVSALQGRKACAFCGLGNPEAFFASVAAAGADVVARVAFNDHVDYDAAALERVARAAADASAELLVTSAKDRVKITDPSALPAPLWTIQVEIGLAAGEEVLVEKIRKAIAR